MKDFFFFLTKVFRSLGVESDLSEWSDVLVI